MKKVLLVSFVLLSFSYWVFGQTTINFDDPAKWTAGSTSITSYAIDHVYADGLFSSTGGPALRNTTATQDGFPGALGTYSWRLQNTTTIDWRITIASGGVSTFSISIRRWDSSPSPDFNLEYSLNGGIDWTFVEVINNTTLNNSSDWTTFNGTINSTNTNILIRLVANGTTERIMIDDFVWTGYTGGANIPPSIANVNQTPSSNITTTTTVSVSADITDSDGTISLAELHWGTASGVLTNTISMSNGGSGDTYTTVSDIPAQVVGTTVFYEVYAEDDDTDPTTSSEFSYEVLFPAFATLPYLQEFDPDLGDMYSYSVVGDQVWGIAGFGNPAPSAKMSGFDGGNLDNEDWVITPAFDLTGVSGQIIFSFEEAINFENSVFDNEKVLISTDYSGIGDPTAATWTELTMPSRSPGNDWTFYSTGDLDLTAYNSSSNVHIAFQYLSSTANAGTWEIDNVSLSAVEQIDYCNLQWPPNGTINLGAAFDVYAQVYEPGVTDAAGQGAGITCWIGFSTTDSDPSTWTDWVLASYNNDQGNNDEYVADIGSVLLASGTYYYASRFQLGSAPYVYGGYPAGFWDGVNHVSGVLTVNPPTTQIDYCNLQWPPNGTITLGDNFDVYAQVYEPGITDSPGQGAGIEAWIGFSTSDTDPSTWTDWVLASYNTDVGNNDEYFANIGTSIPSSGTYYYASRFQLGLAEYVYGGYPAGFWDGTNNVSGVLTVNQPDFSNLIINEVDADTEGTDVLEFIELYDGGTGNTDLSGLVVVLYNGSNDLSYAAYDLDGFSTDANGYFLLGNAGVIPTPSITFGNNFLQNGADAVALYLGNDTDFPNGTIVTNVNILDALVYDTDDSDDSGLLDVLTPGQPQINENGRGNKDFHSNQRIPNGSGGQLVTSTYDQSPPTPAAENMLIYTDWTGAISNEWSEPGNWSNGVPTDMLNVEIQDVSGAKAPFPVITTPGAICNQLFIASNAQLNIGVNGDLTANGLFTNFGTFTIENDGTANVGSFIDNGGITGSGTFNFYREMMGTSSTGTNHGWHYISMPTDGITSDQLIPDYFLNWWDEANDTWVHVEGGDCSNPAVYPFDNGVGYSVLRDLNYTCPNPAGNNLNFGGSFADMHNSGGTYSVAYTANGTFEGGGWNLFGNPYTSPIDNNTMVTDGDFPTSLNAAVYVYDDNTLDYLEFSGGVGVAQVPATQGFFMQATAAGTFTFENGWRTHTGSDNFYKESIADVLALQVSGNDYSDKIYIRFLDEATTGFDRMYDAHKLLSNAEPVPQIYTVSGGYQLAINTLPVTEVVPMSFVAGLSGSYTIEAMETSEFGNVVLEDKFTGAQVNLIENPYTFDHVTGADTDRFLVHFTPLGTAEQDAKNISIWSNERDVYVNIPEVVNGKVEVFNMMGQRVLSENLNTGLNKYTVNGKDGYYIVKVLSSESIVTGKVIIK